MSSCEGCAQKGHGPEECANRDLPMCAQICTCRHGAPEADPPHSTATAAVADGGVPADIDLIANPPTDMAAHLSDAERLVEIRDFHREWGDQDTEALDLLYLWEQLGRLLGVTP